MLTILIAVVYNRAKTKSLVISKLQKLSSLQRVKWPLKLRNALVSY